jgi:hypothetical protein
MTAQMRDSFAWPARHINSISLTSVCLRSLSTSTYDESVFTVVTDEGIEVGIGEDVGFRVTGFVCGATNFFFRLAICG